MMKATDAEIIAAYQETGSVWKAGKALGLCGQSVHERLIKLGANRKVRVFTDEEFDRLREEYQAHATAGTLDALAFDMGRTKHFICRKAGEIGLTKKDRPRAYLRRYADIPEATARAIFDKWVRSKKSIKIFAEANGFGANGLASLFTHWFEADYRAHCERKLAKGNWRYAAGRRFEYRVRDHLAALGAFCMRSPGSKTPVDVLAVHKGQPLFVQCKTSDWHSVKEWNEFMDLAELHGATPIYATRRNNKVCLLLMEGRKDGSRKPMNSKEWSHE